MTRRERTFSPLYGLLPINNVRGYNDDVLNEVSFKLQNSIVFNVTIIQRLVRTRVIVYPLGYYKNTCYTSAISAHEFS